MVDTENKRVGLKKRNNRKKKNFGYLYLFILVFIIALSVLSYFVKSFSPDVDVAIGNNEALTLGETEMNMEVKPVDERLKWIQLEDEMPSVALRNPEAEQDFTFNELEEQKPNVSKTIQNLEAQNSLEEQMLRRNEITEKNTVTQQDNITPQAVIPQQVVVPDFRQISPVVPVIPLPKPMLTKVYVGEFGSLEEAMNIQNKISESEETITPFIKAIGPNYVVQLGSFSDQEKANALVHKMREKGYNVKVINQN